MRRVLLTIIAVFGFAASAVAAERPALKVEVDRTRIYEGESLRYRVTLERVEKPAAPDLKALESDFAVEFLGQDAMQSSFSMTVIVNGKVVRQDSRQGQTYSYRLTPRRPGTLVISAPSISVSGETIRGEPVTITVLPPDDQDIVRMEIRADRATVYPMQPFTVTLSIDVKALPPPFSARSPVSVQRVLPVLQIPWVHDDQLPKGLKPSTAWQEWLGKLENLERHGFAIDKVKAMSAAPLMPNMPGFPNFPNLNDLAGFGESQIAFLPRAKIVPLADKSGKKTDYWHYEFPRTFTAKRIDRFTFGPVTLKGEFATEVTGGQITGGEIYAVAKPVAVEVRDVPREGRPDCYIGAVGKFQLAASLEPRRAKTGDPMTLTVSLEGDGALDDAVPPDLKKTPAIADHFKIYDATQQSKGNRRQFTYSLRPLDADLREFPPIPAAYFDVDAGKYVTLKTDPIPIELTKAQRLSDRDIYTSPGASGAGKEMETRREGIYANITDPSRLGDESVRPERWLIGAGGLFGAYLALLLIVGRWRRIYGDAALLRRRAARGTAKRRLAEASAEFAAGRLNQSAERILDALLGFIADTLGLTSAGLTSTEACRQLETLGVDQKLIDRLAALLETCEGVRYGAFGQPLEKSATAGLPSSVRENNGKSTAGQASSGTPETADVLLRELAVALKRKCKNGNKTPTAAVVGCIVLASLAFLGGCGRTPDVELARKFQTAQRTFENAKTPEDFTKAAMLDQEILDRWGPSGAVFYNQGNAWMQAGQPGRAVAAYRQAQRYSPRLPFLDANLALAVGDASAARRPILETILFWQNWLGYAEKFYWAAASAVVTFLSAAAAMFFSARWLRRTTWTLLALAALPAFSAGYDWYRFDVVQHGVVIQSQTIARKGNAVSYEPAFEKPLRETTEFQVIERRGDWLLVRLPDGGNGWIEDKAAVTY